MAVGARSVQIPSESDFYTWQSHNLTFGPIGIRGHTHKRAQGASIHDFEPDSFIKNALELIREGEDAYFKRDFRDHNFEQFMAKTLDEFDISHMYEPFFLTTIARRGRKTFKWLPDFVTDLKIDGRRVIIEPHGVPIDPDTGKHQVPPYVVSNKLTRKFQHIENAFGDKYYIILCLDDDLAARVAKFLSKNRDARIADEIWTISLANPNKEGLLDQKLSELKYRAGHRNIPEPRDVALMGVGIS